MASRNFTNLADHLARARINFGSDSFKGILVTSVPTESNLDTWDFRNDITNEVAATGGYTAGGFAVTASVGTVDAANDRVAVTFSAASPTYTSSTISARGVIVYKDTGTASDSPLAHFVDFGETVASTNGNFTVTFTTPLYINANPA
jgi:hypothetical protein